MLDENAEKKTQKTEESNQKLVEVSSILSKNREIANNFFEKLKELKIESSSDSRSVSSRSSK